MNYIISFLCSYWYMYMMLTFNISHLATPRSGGMLYPLASTNRHKSSSLAAKADFGLPPCTDGKSFFLSGFYTFGTSKTHICRNKVYTCMLQTLTSHKSHFLLIFDGKTYINEKVIHERVYFSGCPPLAATTTSKRPLKT